MKLRTLAAAAAVSIAMGLGGLYASTRPVAIAPGEAARPAPAPAILAAGARVVALGDCMVCHTATDGAAYAGGLALKTPFGTIYSTNITPDPETGIGRWPLPAFRRAMREGVARDGHLLYPSFPYIHTTRMSDRDIEMARYGPEGIVSIDWSGYPILRFSGVPERIDVALLDQPGQPFLGVAEAAQGPMAAAIANALADATGVPRHDLPLLWRPLQA